jgi:hypothetical protein
MITDPDPFDRPAVLAALETKRDDVQRRMRQTLDMGELRSLAGYRSMLDGAILDVRWEVTTGRRLSEMTIAEQFAQLRLDDGTPALTREVGG